MPNGSGQEYDHSDTEAREVAGNAADTAFKAMREIETLEQRVRRLEQMASEHELIMARLERDMVQLLHPLNPELAEAFQTQGTRGKTVSPTATEQHPTGSSVLDERPKTELKRESGERNKQTQSQE